MTRSEHGTSSVAATVLAVTFVTVGCAARDPFAGEVEAIQLPICEATDAGPTEAGAQDGGTSCVRTLWPNRRIPYSFEGFAGTPPPGGTVWSEAEKTAVRNVATEWESMTQGFIDFVEVDATAPDYNERVRLWSDIGGCSAGLPGWDAAPGPQGASVRNCGAATTRHELGHVIGLSHQHQRSDRDRYVLLNETILCGGLGLYYDNLVKCIGGDGTDFGVYDVGSVLHYWSAYPNGCTNNCSMMQRNCTTTGARIEAAQVATIKPGDASGVVELYRGLEGWDRFRPVLSKDPPPPSNGCPYPLDMQLAPGVTMVGAPAVSSQGTDLLDVFARGSNNRIYHKFFVDGWQGEYWYDLGGNKISEPAAVSWGPGRVDLVAKGSDGNIYQKTFANSAWGNWMSLGAPPSGATSAPAIASWGANRLDVFVRGGTGGDRLYQKTWQGSWGGWVSRGGHIKGRPSAVSWGLQRIDVVVTGTDDAVWRLPYSSGWGSWERIGGIVGAGTHPAISSTGVGKLHIFVTGTNGRLWHKRFDGAWAPWADVGGIPSGNPATVGWPTGRVNVVANLQGNGLWHRYQQ